MPDLASRWRRHADIERYSKPQLRQPQTTISFRSFNLHSSHRQASRLATFSGLLARAGIQISRKRLLPRTHWYISSCEAHRIEASNLLATRIAQIYPRPSTFESKEANAGHQDVFVGQGMIHSTRRTQSCSMVNPARRLPSGSQPALPMQQLYSTSGIDSIRARATAEIRRENRSINSLRASHQYARMVNRSNERPRISRLVDTTCNVSEMREASTHDRNANSCPPTVEWTFQFAMNTSRIRGFVTDNPTLLGCKRVGMGAVGAVA
jgi:hypothetical protein